MQLWVALVATSMGVGLLVWVAEWASTRREARLVSCSRLSFLFVSVISSLCWKGGGTNLGTVFLRSVSCSASSDVRFPEDNSAVLGACRSSVCVEVWEEAFTTSWSGFVHNGIYSFVACLLSSPLTSCDVNTGVQGIRRRV